MKCILLAAGYATRLYPLTANFPKPLLPVGGSTILDRIVADVDAATDVHEFIVISNHKFAVQFADWAAKSVHNIRVVDDGTDTNETRLGAVKDIWYAVETLGLDDDLLIMAGDNVLDFSLAGFVRFAAEKGTSCVMCHEENELRKQQKTAIITVNGDDRITSYEEKPVQPKGNLAVPPFYVYRAAAMFYYANKVQAFEELKAAYQREHIRFFAVKGLEVAAMYPVPAFRTMGGFGHCHVDGRPRARL